MIIEKQYSWGKLKYDTSAHRFSLVHTNGKTVIPYLNQPVVLNAYLTMNCNMNCRHCVTKDFGETRDLVISNRLINWINGSPFMVLVITGGEPLLPEYEAKLMILLQETQRKGLIIDTNGTLFPSSFILDTIVQTNTLVRVSWDSTRSYDEIYFRQAMRNTKQNEAINLEYYHKKIDTIQRLRTAGIKVAVQSVIHKQNRGSIIHMTEALRELSLDKWYIQRFVPSYKAATQNFEVSNSEYDEVTEELTERCHEVNIECIIKKDRRHNCIVQLVGDGLVYTQGEKPREKIPLGKIDSDISYFEYISSADHAERYYG